MNNKNKKPLFLFCVLFALFISEGKSATAREDIDVSPYGRMMIRHHDQNVLDRNRDTPSPLGLPSAKRSRSNPSPRSVSDTLSRASPTLLIAPLSKEWGLGPDDFFTEDLLAKAQNFQTFLPDDTILSLMTLGAYYMRDVILTDKEEESPPLTFEQLLLIIDHLAQMEKKHPNHPGIISDFVCTALEDYVPTASFPLQLFYLSLFEEVFVHLRFNEEGTRKIIASATLFMLPEHTEKERVYITQIVGNYIRCRPEKLETLTSAEEQSWSVREVIPRLKDALFPEEDEGLIDPEERKFIAELGRIFPEGAKV